MFTSRFHEQGSYNGVSYALAEGQLATAKWLHSQGVPYRPEAGDESGSLANSVLTRCGLEGLQWLVSIGERMDAELPVSAVDADARSCDHF